MKHSLRVGVLMVLIALALGACGGVEKEAKARPYQRTLKPCALANTARRNSNPHSPSELARAGRVHHWSCPITWPSLEE